MWKSFALSGVSGMLKSSAGALKELLRQDHNVTLHFIITLIGKKICIRTIDGKYRSSRNDQDISPEVEVHQVIIVRPSWRFFHYTLQFWFWCDAAERHSFSVCLLCSVNVADTLIQSETQGIRSSQHTRWVLCQKCVFSGTKGQS